MIMTVKKRGDSTIMSYTIGGLNQGSSPVSSVTMTRFGEDSPKAVSSGDQRERLCD